MLFQNKTFFITGATRGIGKAIALKLAADGANIVIAAKSTEEHPKLGGTIYTAAREIEDAGGKALPVACDIRFEEQVQHAVQQAIGTFGSIDGLINNASAIALAGTEQLQAKQFDLMFDINVRGTFLVTKHCIPHLKKAANAHIITLSPPLNITPKWFAQHAPYTISKYNMSMMAMGWAAEYKTSNIASNSLWPATLIATAAVRNLLGGEKLIQRSRKPEIIADAAHYILQQPAGTCTGNFFIDEEILKQAGVTDFSHYAVDINSSRQKDLFLD